MAPVADTGRIDLDWALALLEGLAAAGVETLVISPGSRSTPLALGGWLQPQLETLVILDERCAAFTALGLARVSKRPVALVATSGSAPANWMPAVLEADEAGVPLILLSADRPWELQQCGANQTTDQLGLFGAHVRAFHALSEAQDDPGLRDRLRRLGRQAVFQAQGIDPGPVHINLRFREPLVPAGPLPEPEPVGVRPQAVARLLPGESQLARLRRQLADGQGLILAGTGAEPGVIDLAEALGVPLLADPLSDLRYPGRSSTVLIADYDRLLGDGETMAALRPRWILQFGALPISANLHKALRRWQVAAHWVVTPRGRWIDPLGLAAEMVAATPQVLCEALLAESLPTAATDWLSCWKAAGAPPGEILAEGRLVQALFDTLPDQSLLLCGNSLAVRWVDAWSGSGARRIAIHGNRGLSGIDGNLSTFVGLARGWRGRGRKAALLGDLTFQHDLGALANVAGLDAVVVVIDNGGGGIFDRLPQRNLPAYESLWRTPQALDLAALPELFGIGFRRTPPGELATALEAAWEAGGFQVVEVRLTGQPV